MVDLESSAGAIKISARTGWRRSGPASLVLFPLAFFIASPGPTRHFMLTYAGLSIFLAVALTANLALGRMAALA